MPHVAAASPPGCLAIRDYKSPRFRAFIAEAVGDVESGCSSFRKLDSRKIEQLAQLAGREPVEPVSVSHAC